jgi:hypothetical protein
MSWVYNASPAVNAESNYPTILGVSITLVVLMAVVVCLRFYVRGHMLKVVGLDDWVIAAGSVSHTPYYPFVFEVQNADIYLLSRSAALYTMF